MRTFLSLVLVWFWLGASLTALEEEKAVHLAAQDGSGVIWIQERYGGVMSRYAQGKFHRVYLFPINREPNEITPLQLTTRRDGVVIGLWRVEKERKMMLTRHYGEKTSVIGIYPHTMPDHMDWIRSGPFCDSRNRLWITAGAPEIHRLDPDADAPVTIRLPDEIFFRESKEGRYNPIEVVEDPRGRIWLWSVDQASNYRSIQGSYVFDGEHWKHHAFFPWLPKPGDFLAFGVFDERRLWIGGRDQLFWIDLETLEATAIPVPIDRNYFEITSLWVHGGERYIHFRGYDWQWRLWRWREKGWDEVLNTPQEGTFLSSTGQKESLEWEGYRFFGVEGSAARVLYRDGQSWHWGWHSRFPHEHLCRVFPLGGGEMMLLAGRMNYLAKVAPVFPPVKASERIHGAGHFPSRFGVDRRQHFWRIREESCGSPSALEEWDGLAWTERRLPEGIKAGEYERLVTSKDGRIWLLNEKKTLPILSLEPQRGEWRIYRSFEQFCRVLADLPVEWEEPTGRATGQPVFAPDGKRYVWLERESYHYFDGANHHQWPISEVLKTYREAGSDLPFFYTSGEPGFRISSREARLREGRWEEPPKEESLWTTTLKGRPGEPIPGMEDAYWLHRDEMLFKIRAGRKVALLREGEPAPLMKHRHVSDVREDALGNFFFISSNGRPWAYRFNPNVPLLSLELKARANWQGWVDVQLTSEGEAELLRWRIGNEPWREVKPGGRWKIDGLSPGRYQVEVEGYDKLLRRTTVCAQVKVWNAPRDHVARWRGWLKSGSAEERERAQAAFERQSVLAKKKSPL